MKKLLSLLLIALLALSFTACSDDDDDGGPTAPDTYKISGTVTDADGNGVANVTIEAATGSETETATTDAQGTFEITDLTSGATYTVSAVANDYYFNTSNNQVTLNADATVNFTAVGLYGTWVSEGANVAPLLFSLFGTARVEATFNSNGSYEVVQTDTAGASVTLSGTFTMTKSSVGNIFEITANQTSPAALTSEGIFEINSTATPYTMQYEIVQTSPDIGATPPTPSAGFGSTNGGGLGTINIQTYVRQ